MSSITDLTMQMSRKYPPRGALCRVGDDGELVAARTIEEATAVVVDVRVEPGSSDTSVRIVCDTVEFPAGAATIAEVDALVARVLDERRRAAVAFG